MKIKILLLAGAFVLMCSGILFAAPHSDHGRGWGWGRDDDRPRGRDWGHSHKPHHVVPEPISSALFILGGCTLGLSLYRRRKK
jgi:hypothetical protein